MLALEYTAGAWSRCGVNQIALPMYTCAVRYRNFEVEASTLRSSLDEATKLTSALQVHARTLLPRSDPIDDSPCPTLLARKRLPMASMPRARMLYGLGKVHVGAASALCPPLCMVK